MLVVLVGNVSQLRIRQRHGNFLARHPGEEAVEGNELRVYCQPKIGLASSSVEGVEALIRWEHPRRGFISPIDFIPFAEHTGYIIFRRATCSTASCRR